MERYWIANGILASNEWGGLVKYDDAQRALDGERTAKEACQSTGVDLRKQLATLQAQLADRDAMILQMGEQAAVLAKENMAVKAHLRQVEGEIVAKAGYVKDKDRVYALFACDEQMNAYAALLTHRQSLTQTAPQEGGMGAQTEVTV